MIVFPNATLAVKRGGYDPVAKQTAAAVQVASGVQARVEDRSGGTFRLRGIAAEEELVVYVDASVDLRDGDILTGYLAASTAQGAPVLQVQHVAVWATGTWAGYKLARVRAMQP